MTDAHRTELQDMADFCRLIGLFHLSAVLRQDGDDSGMLYRATCAAAAVADATFGSWPAWEVMTWMHDRLWAIWLGDSAEDRAHLAPLAKAEAAEVDATSVYNSDNDFRPTGTEE